MTSPQITFAANQGDIGGGEVMLLNLATAARDLGVHVEVVGPRSSGVVAAAEESGFVVHGLGATRRDYLLALRRWRGRGQLLWANGLAPAFATSGQGGRVVHLHQRPLGKQAIAARAARVGARVTLVPSQSSACHVPGARVLQNWTSEVVVEPRPGRINDRVIGFLGRPSVGKGVVVLAEAVSILAARSDSPPQLVLAGESHFVAPEEQALVAVALRSIDGLLERQGWTSPAEFFAHIDLAVFPSTVPESFGLVAAEAMSARVPFVVSDAGALPEVAGPAYPWVARHGDANVLADMIEAALNAPPEETARVVASARDRWEKCFSPDAGRVRLAQLLSDLNVV